MKYVIITYRNNIFFNLAYKIMYCENGQILNIFHRQNRAEAIKLANTWSHLHFER
jgi:hypothetical protein